MGAPVITAELFVGDFLIPLAGSFAHFTSLSGQNIGCAQDPGAPWEEAGVGPQNAPERDNDGNDERNAGCDLSECSGRFHVFSMPSAGIPLTVFTDGILQPDHTDRSRSLRRIDLLRVGLHEVEPGSEAGETAVVSGRAVIATRTDPPPPMSAATAVFSISAFVLPFVSARAGAIRCERGVLPCVRQGRRAALIFPRSNAVAPIFGGPA
jgi:hypothetical protein